MADTLESLEIEVKHSATGAAGEIGKVADAVEMAIGADYFVDIQTVALTNIDFSDAFEKAVEEKMVADQKKLQAEIEKVASENGLSVKEVAKRVNLNQLAFSLEQSKVIDLLKETAVAPAKKTTKKEA